MERAVKTRGRWRGWKQRCHQTGSPIAYNSRGGATFVRLLMIWDVEGFHQRQDSWYIHECGSQGRLRKQWRGEGNRTEWQVCSDRYARACWHLPLRRHGLGGRKLISGSTVSNKREWLVQMWMTQLRTFPTPQCFWESTVRWPCWTLEVIYANNHLTCAGNRSLSRTCTVQQEKILRQVS